MAEIKNTFLKSKMNKDLDERLLPNGEYRDAQNIAVSKSEDSNVGAAENIQGTELVLNGDIGIQITNLLGLGGTYLKACGQCVDEINGKLYLFLTNNTDNSLTYQTATNINHAIVRYDFATGGIFLYSAGKFLNFSYAYKIRNVNLIEDLLFFTDNRNQPRVISVREEFATPISRFTTIADLAYTTEDHVTVCKYAPHKAIDVYKETAPGVFETTMTDALTPNLPVIVEAKTDFTPAPGAIIEVDLALPPFIAPFSLAINDLKDLQIWTSDGQINQTDNAYVILAGPPDGLAANEIQVAYRAGGAPTLRFPLGVGLYFGPQNPNFVNNAGVSTYAGDGEFLKDKFVRFSYRFKFLNGEYSIMAPFTQACFIPENFGYFVENSEEETYESTVVNFMQNQVNRILLQIPMPDDTDGTQLNADELRGKLKVSEIDILYKESDGLAVQVVETLDTNDLDAAGAVTTYEYEYQSTEPFRTLPEAQTTRVYDKVPVKAHGQEIISNRVVYSNFQNKHTPPETLDYNVGVSSKFDATTTGATNNLGDYAFYGYPNHSLKQNRTYQVGVVLSDRYGRTSTVILSNNQSFVTASGTNFGGDTINWPYRDSFDNFYGSDDLLHWPGDSLKVYFNNLISSTKNEQTGTPGLYNGDTSSPNYNPLGWYTWKIVVKQKEQEYYNVYLPGILNGHPEQAPQFIPNNEEGEIAHVTLINDNINKVPRDLSEVGPDQTQYRSSVRMWGRVTPQIYVNDNPSSGFTDNPYYNSQYYPLIPADTVSAIGKMNELFQSRKGGSIGPFEDIYEEESNPLLGRVITRKPIGSLGATPTLPPANPLYPFWLSVYETAPTESRLEIFWETSTSGRVKDLNTAIDNSLPAGTPSTLENLEGPGNINFKEDRDYTDPDAVYTDGTGPIITNDFYPEDAGGATINDAMSMTMTVVDGNGTDVTSKFNLVRTAGTGNGGPATTPNGFVNPVYDTFTIQLADYFVYLEDANIRNFQATFNITNTVTGITTTGINSPFNFALENVAPTIQFIGITHWNYNEFVPFGGGPGLPPEVTAVNGTALVLANEPNELRELVFSIVSQTQYGQDVEIFDLNPSTDGQAFIIQQPQTIMSGPYEIQIAVVDANGTGATDIVTIDFDFGELSVNCNMLQDNTSSTFPVFLNGADLGGVWWSKASGDGTLPGNYNNASLPSWASGAGADFPSVPVPTNPANDVTLTGPCPGQQRLARSFDASEGPSWCTATPNGLRRGVWYVTVTLTQTITELDSTYPDFINANFQLAIQERQEDPIYAAWTDAEDIEGNIISSSDSSIATFNRGEWLINYPDNTIASGFDYAVDGGTLRDTTGALNSYPTPYSNQMYAQAAKPQSISTSNPPLNISISRTFAFNKVKYGYRVLVNTIKGTLVEGFTGCAATYKNSDNVELNITYGDFYYPQGQTTIAWAYQVSQVGEPDEGEAQQYNESFTTVYAREPIFRYVTQFYTNQQLTTPWSPTQPNPTNNWHTYKRVPGAGPGGVSPSPFGDDNAAVSFANANSNQSDRRWIAQFNSSGTKLNGTAYPTVN